MWILARTRISPGSQVNVFRQELQALDPELLVYGPFTLADRLERYWDSRFYGGLFLIFKSTREIHDNLEGEAPEQTARRAA